MATFDTKLSTLNSTNTPLNNAATFTGTAELCWMFSAVVVAVFTDRSGQFFVDFSTDGTNWDSTLTFNVAASTNEVHRITITRPYMRVRFTNNSGSNQTFLRLSTIYGTIDNS